MPADVAGVGPGAADGLPPLVDHHCHGVLRYEPDLGTFAGYLTESDRPPATGRWRTWWLNGPAGRRRTGRLNGPADHWRTGG